MSGVTLGRRDATPRARVLRFSMEQLFVGMVATSVIGIGISYSDVYLFHVAGLGLILLYLLVRVGKLPRLETRSRLHLYFYVQLAWFAASVIWAADIGLALRYLVYLVIGSSLSLSVMYFSSTMERLDSLVRGLTVVFMVDVVAGMLEAFTGFRLPFSRFSPLAQAMGREPADLSELSRATQSYLLSMPTGFHWNPNNFATAMNVILPYIVVRKRGVVRVLLAVVLVLLIVQCASRANILASALILVLYLSVFRQRTFRLRRAFLWAVACLLTVVALVSVLSLPWFTGIGAFGVKLGDVSNILRVLQVFLLERVVSGSSIGVRQQLILNGLGALIRSRGLGVGGGNSQVVQAASGLATLSMHNYWVELLVEGGVGLFVAFMVFYGRTAVALFRASFTPRLPVALSESAKVGALVLVGFVPAAVSASSVVYFLPMYVMLGYALAVVNLAKTSRGHAVPAGVGP